MHGLQSLIDVYHIKARVYKNEKLVVLNYSQRDSPKFEPIVDECRALILELNTWKIVSKSFGRFYNYQEGNRIFDFEQALIYEKVDGSLMSVYHYQHRWCVASRGMAFAEGETKFKATFAEVFSEAFNFAMLEQYPEHWCFSFELVSPKTRVVKRYPFTDVYLLSIFDRETERELSQKRVDEIAHQLKVMRPKLYELDIDMTEAFDHLEATDEGYVCVIELKHGTVERVKVKNPSYLAIAHLRSNDVLSPKRICWLVINHEQAEYLGYFPEDEQCFQAYEKAYQILVDEIQCTWLRTQNIEEQKDFAMSINHLDYAGVLFAKRKDLNISLNELIVKAKLDGVTRWIQERVN